jgi:hypothetical protein
MKSPWKFSAALAILAPASLLIGCASASSARKASLNLYQPPVLRLEQGQVIATKDGLHTPQMDEVWHSDARFRELENELVNAAAALAQERARAGR